MNDTSTVPGLPDDAFEHDGLITKRHVRAGAFAFLRPASGELLWDVGLGSGAMAIEWCRAAPGARAIGLERNPERAARAVRNVAALAPGAVEVREGDVAALVADLPTPDAVFVGGGASPAVVARCWDALPSGGRIVVHGVTVETEAVCVGAYREHGGSLTRIGVETAEPIGRLLGWTPARAITQWAATKA